MECNFKKYLSAYQDGELSPEEQAVVSHHLEDCQACRESYAELQQVWSAFEKAKNISPSANFFRIVLAKVEGKRRKPDFIEKLVSTFQPFPAVGSLITVMGMGLIIGIFLGNNLADTGRATNSIQITHAVGTTDINAFKVFAPHPPGSLEENYLKLTKYKENNDNEG